MEELVGQIGEPLIVVLVSLLVSLAKRGIERLPKWALPILAAVLGPILDQIIAYVASVPAMGWQASALGLAGVGLREVVDQTTKAIKKRTEA